MREPSKEENEGAEAGVNVSEGIKEGGEAMDLFQKEGIKGGVGREMFHRKGRERRR